MSGRLEKIQELLGIRSFEVISKVKKLTNYLTNEKIISKQILIKKHSKLK